MTEAVMNTDSAPVLPNETEMMEETSKVTSEAESMATEGMEAVAPVLQEVITEVEETLPKAVMEVEHLAAEAVQAVSGHDGILENAYFWVILSTLIFVAIAWQKGRGVLLKMLDNRSEKIETELNEAEQLRIEAQELLAEYQRKHRDAVKTADKIIAQAKEQAKTIKQEAEADLEEHMVRKKAQLAERIERAELSAIQEVREQAAEIASSAAEKLVIDALSKNGSKLVDDAISGLPKKLDVA